MGLGEFDWQADHSKIVIKSDIDNDAVVVSVVEADNCSSPQFSCHSASLSSKHVIKVCISSQDGPSKSLLSSEEAEEV